MNSRWHCLQKLATGAAVLVAGGCVMQPELRIYSQPEGAYISSLGSGELYGMAPTVIRFDKAELASHADANGCYIFDGVEAQWGSGATTSLKNIHLCGDDWQHSDVVLSRPAGSPGLDKDLQVELQLRATRARELQAMAAMQQAQAAELEAEAYQRAIYLERQERYERHQRDEQHARETRGNEGRDHENRDHANHDNTPREENRNQAQPQQPTQQATQQPTQQAAEPPKTLGERHANGAAPARALDHSRQREQPPTAPAAPAVPVAPQQQDDSKQ